MSVLNNVCLLCGYIYFIYGQFSEISLNIGADTDDKYRQTDFKVQQFSFVMFLGQILLHEKEIIHKNFHQDLQNDSASNFQDLVNKCFDMAKLYVLFSIHGSFDIKVSRNFISDCLNKDEKCCTV